MLETLRNGYTIYKDYGLLADYVINHIEIYGKIEPSLLAKLVSRHDRCKAFKREHKIVATILEWIW